MLPATRLHESCEETSPDNTCITSSGPLTPANRPSKDMCNILLMRSIEWDGA